jgi:dienelactone hydrolase
MTREDLWKGFDPEALPLDVQLVDQWQQDGIALKKVFFTSEIWKGAPVRVYAIYGAPVGRSDLPAVLHIHGGGGCASLEEVLYWAKHGYAAASFDHMGNLPGRTVFTHWGKVKNTVTYGAWGDDPRNDMYYHAIIASLRMVTFLASQPEVDPDHIGAYGISYGGMFIWVVSSLDNRLKCAAPIVGSGSAEDQWGEGSLREWNKLYNPSLYASSQKCPILLMNASNDFNAIIDNADYTYRLVNTDKRQVYQVSYNHNLEPQVSHDLLMWMDWRLRGAPAWPKTPELHVTLGPDGVPVAEVKPDTEQRISSISVRYNLDTGVMPQARFWRSVVAEKKGEGNTWRALMPIMDVSQTVRAYCDVYYRNRVVLSSVLTRFIPSNVDGVRATLKPERVLDNFDGGRILDWVWYPCGPNPTSSDERGPLLKPIVNGPDGGWAIGANGGFIKGSLAATTTKICDPQYAPRERKHLAFRVRGPKDVRLTVVLVRDFWRPTQNEFKCELNIPQGEQWPRLVVSPSDFKNKDGQTLDSWVNLQQLRFESQFAADKQVALANVEWAD